jgi:hypothetical protein
MVTMSASYRKQPSMVPGAGPAIRGRSLSRARDAIQRIA